MRNGAPTRSGIPCFDVSGAIVKLGHKPVRAMTAHKVRLTFTGPGSVDLTVTKAAPQP